MKSLLSAGRNALMKAEVKKIGRQSARCAWPHSSPANFGPNHAASDSISSGCTGLTNRTFASTALVLLKDVPSVDHQDLSSNVGGFGRSEETNGGSHFLRRAGAAERCMKRCDFFSLRRGRRCDPTGSDGVHRDSIARRFD